MKNNFNKKIAKEIAFKQFEWTLGCIGLGTDDFDYNLKTDVSKFETSFTEDLEEKNIIVTQKRIEIINNIYESYTEKAIDVLEKLHLKIQKTIK